MPTRPRRRRLLATACLLVLALAVGACGGGDDEDTSSATTVGSQPASSAPNGSSPTASGTVDIKGFTFSPKEVTVKAGGTVTWTNRDGFAHTVRSDNAAFAESKNLDQGSPFSHTFAKPGRYSYICGIHNSMKGTVVVV